MGRRHKKDGLESKVAKAPRASIHTDEDHRAYLPLCNYSWHIGVIKDEEVCKTRNCRHYLRAYLDEARKPSTYDLRGEEYEE